MASDLEQSIVRIGSLSDSQMPVVDAALGVSLGIANQPQQR